MSVKKRKWIKESLDSNEFRLILVSGRELRMEWKRELRFAAASAAAANRKHLKFEAETGRACIYIYKL